MNIEAMPEGAGTESVGIHDSVLADEHTCRLVQSCISLNVLWSEQLPDTLRSVVWSGPSAARNPENDLFWHPVHERAGTVRKIMHYVSVLARAVMGGAYRTIRYRGLRYLRLDSGAPMLLVVPQIIVERSGRFRTSYLTDSADCDMDKLVLQCEGPECERRRLGGRARLGASIRLLLTLARSVSRNVTTRGLTWTDVDATVMCAAWALSQAWCRMSEIEQVVSECIRARRYEAIVVLHEMHPYSRVVWRAARAAGLRSISAQHAVIIPEKLWYFPAAAERAAGCDTPDVFFVYSEETAALLRPSYPSTSFRSCCSPRFASWRSLSATDLAQNARSAPGERILLLVSAAIFHDVTVILETARSLVRRGVHREWHVRVRLHPDAALSMRDKGWLWRATRRGVIERTMGSLADDLRRASVVGGAYSTVLQEALLNGIPIVGLTNRKYRPPATFPGGTMCETDRITGEALIGVAAEPVTQDSIQRARRTMGLQNPVLTTELIYEAANLLRDAKARFEREYIAADLEQHQGRIPETAGTLGIQRTNL